MKNKIKKIWSIVLAGIIIVGAAEAITSWTLSWTGQGTTGGQLDDVECTDNLPRGIDPGEAYLLWVLTPGGSTLSDVSKLELGGTGSGSYDYLPHNGGGSYRFVTPYFTPNYPELTATVSYTDGSTQLQQLTISHGCPGPGPGPGTQIPEFPTIALPIAAMIGLVFLFQHRRKKEE